MISFLLALYFTYCKNISINRLAGKTLFEGNDEREVVKKNKDCEIDYEFKNDPKFTDQIRDLLRKMLQKDPKSRSSA